MAMPVTDDCNPAIAGAARRLRAASVSGSLQGYAQLAFDHGLDEAAHPITHHGFNRVEPIVERYTAVSATGCEESCFVVMLFMAWSWAIKSKLAFTSGSLSLYQPLRTSSF